MALLALTSAQYQFPGPEDGNSDSTSRWHELRQCSYYRTVLIDVVRQSLGTWTSF